MEWAPVVLSKSHETNREMVIIRIKSSANPPHGQLEVQPKKVLQREAVIKRGTEMTSVFVVDRKHLPINMTLSFPGGPSFFYAIGGPPPASSSAG